jgi:cell fate (sporulation/competence/biofilm development) regulator YlbF (YheA/YmcA/DUF963 family)
MKDILELAQRLGKAISDSPQAVNIRACRAAMHADKVAGEAMKAYQVQAEKMEKLQEEEKPIEVADKHKLQELHDQLVAIETFKKYTAAQLDYVDLMRKVNDALHHQLAETEAH